MIKCKNTKSDDLNIFVWPLCLLKEQIEKATQLYASVRFNEIHCTSYLSNKRDILLEKKETDKE